MLALDHTIPLTIERSKKRRKSIAILIHPQRGVVVQAPDQTSDRTIQKMLDERHNWIEKKWQVLQAQLPEVENDHFDNGRLLPFLDEYYQLEVWPVPAQRNQYDCIDNILLVRLQKPDQSSRSVQIKKLIERWYRQNATEVLTERTAYFAELLNVKPQGIIIKSQKSRWGSCDRQNVIRYNWKIIMTPLALLDYLVVHELAHIREKNHSPAFWAVVASVLPDYAIRRKALKALHVNW